MPEQTCGNCKHGTRWVYTKHTPPRINSKQPGLCVYPIQQPVWPLSVREWSRYSMPRPGGVDSFETGCPCWEAK